MTPLTLRGITITPETLHDDLISLEYGTETYPDTDAGPSPIRKKEAIWLINRLGAWVTDVLSVPGKPIRKFEHHETDYSIFEYEIGEYELVRHAIGEEKVLEVAGPTDWEDGTIMDSYGITPNVTTNILAQVDLTQHVEPYVVSDARTLPFANNSFGGVYISCLPGAFRHRDPGGTELLRDYALHEARRVLRPGGVLIWSGGTQADLVTLSKLKMDPLHVYIYFGRGKDPYGQDRRYTVSSPWFEGAFQK